MIYRKGAIGAMMDEYEKAVRELMAVFHTISERQYEKIHDPNTSDENCRSFQTILSHVVSSGYSYADYLRAPLGMPSSRPPERMLSFAEVPHRMEEMMRYTVETLQDHWEMPEEQIMAIRFQSDWGPTYDAEQNLEHAIVHILRHRRQIQKWLSSFAQSSLSSQS